MNKKLLAGIIAGAVALAAVVFVLCAGLFNWFHWDWFAAQNNGDASEITSETSVGESTAAGENESGTSATESTTASASSGTSSASTASESADSAAEAHETPADFYEDVTSVATKGETTVETGKYIVVPVTMSENPGVNLGLVEFVYDAAALEYVDYDEGKIFDTYTVTDNADNGVVKFLLEMDGLDDTEKTGKVVTLKFKVRDDAAAGSYTVTAGSGTQFSNQDEELVSPAFEIGGIAVK